MHDELYEGFRLDEEEELDNAPTGEGADEDEDDDEDDEAADGLDEEAM